MSKYRVTMHVVIDVTDQGEAVAQAKKLLELFKDPWVRAAIEGAGVRLSGGDGQPVVYNPQPTL